MKKSLLFAASLLIALLAFHFTATAVQPPADPSAALKKAMADLDASTAQLNRFVSDQAQSRAASTPAQSAELQKLMADLKATTAHFDRFLKNQAQTAAAPEGMQSAQVQKAMAELDASAAEINKFVSDQPPVAAVPKAASQLSTRFGSRPPRACPNITSTPSATQAATLVQCTMDY